MLTFPRWAIRLHRYHDNVLLPAHQKAGNTSFIKVFYKIFLMQGSWRELLLLCPAALWWSLIYSVLDNFACTHMDSQLRPATGCGEVCSLKRGGCVTRGSGRKWGERCQSPKRLRSPAEIKPPALEKRYAKARAALFPTVQEIKTEL